MSNIIDENNCPHVTSASAEATARQAFPSAGEEGISGDEFDREEWFRRNGDLKHRPVELQAEMARRLSARECTQVELAAWLAHEHQIDTHQPGISRWYRWYRRPERPWNRGAIIEQAVAKLVELNPHLTEDERFERGQTAFAEQAITDRDVDTWCKTQRLMIARRNLKVREAKQRAAEADRAAEAKAVEEKKCMQIGTTEESMSRFERDLGLMPSHWVKEEGTINEINERRRRESMEATRTIVPEEEKQNHPGQNHESRFGKEGERPAELNHGWRD